MASPGERARVLYVEDDPPVAALVREALAATCAVEIADDGFTALERAATAPPDLLLVDLHLPTLSGFEVIKRWRRSPALAGIPVVVVSARVMSDEAEEALALGCAAFVEKPFTIQGLRDAVSAALSGVAGRPPLSPG